VNAGHLRGKPQGMQNMKLILICWKILIPVIF